MKVLHFMVLKNKTYDVLKFISTLIVPLTAFLTTMAEIWGFTQQAAPIIATITAVGTLIGAIINVSSANYNKEVDGSCS